MGRQCGKTWNTAKRFENIEIPNIRSETVLLMDTCPTMQCTKIKGIHDWWQHSRQQSQKNAQTNTKQYIVGTQFAFCLCDCSDSCSLILPAHTLYHFLFAQNIKGHDSQTLRHDATDSRLKTEDTSSHYFLQGIEFETFNPPLFETQNEADMFRTAPQTEL